MMKYWKEYIGHTPDIRGIRNKFDNNIYTFDIETSSYYILNNKVYSGCSYDKLNEKDRKNAIVQTTMYIWMFSINDQVYYGRTWEEFKRFITILDNFIDEKKIVFVHNLAFEFQFLSGEFNFCNVVARKPHKPMKAELSDYNIEFRCSYMMSNCSLSNLAKVYQLPVNKKVGDLDYTKIRTSITKLDDIELGYCEYDCLVVYHYIKKELETYENVKNLPITSTSHVRRELKNLVMKDYSYKSKVYRAINIDPHIYNLLIQAFQGGYTHANYGFASIILDNISSFDFTSSYPYVLVSYKYPSTRFKKCKIVNVSDLSDKLAYLLVVKMYDVKCKFINTFISSSKCRNIRGGKYDNGRIIEAKELEITLTDVDFKFLFKAYDFKYEVLESYYSRYDYLPIKFINFVLDKYVAKTKYKGVVGKELEYNLEKAKFNSLYGMSVTNNIRDEVIYSNEDGWSEVELTNSEIEESLQNELKRPFLSFAYGVWVTAWARNNLLENVIKLDDYVIYCDTDSMKLREGFNIDVINSYNESVLNRLHHVSDLLNIPYDRFSPTDIKEKSRPLGVFDNDDNYKKFITQGAKKYAYIEEVKNSDVRSNDNVVSSNNDTSDVLKITVAGVPKCGARALKSLSDFNDNFIFPYEYTNKNTLFYCDNMIDYDITDYQGNTYTVTDKKGCSLMSTSYTLAKSIEYATLISDFSSKRAIYKE